MLTAHRGSETVGTRVIAVKGRLTAAGAQKHNVELLTHRLKQATSVLFLQLSCHFQS